MPDPEVGIETEPSQLPVPVPWAICSRDSRTSPVFASIHARCQEAWPSWVPRTSTSYASLVPASRARSPARDSSSPRPGRPASSRLPWRAPRGSSPWCSRCRRVPPARRRFRPPGRRRWRGRRSRRRRRGGPRACTRRPSRRWSWSPRGCRCGRRRPPRRARARPVALHPGGGCLLGLGAGVARRGCGVGRGGGRCQERRSDGCRCDTGQCGQAGCLHGVSNQEFEHGSARGRIGCCGPLHKFAIRGLGVNGRRTAG